MIDVPWYTLVGPKRPLLVHRAIEEMPLIGCIVHGAVYKPIFHIIRRTSVLAVNALPSRRKVFHDSRCEMEILPKRRCMQIPKEKMPMRYQHKSSARKPAASMPRTRQKKRG